MANPTPFVRVYFDDGTFITPDGCFNPKKPVTRSQANFLARLCSELNGKRVVSVERTDDIDTEYETYGYNNDGELVTEYRREDAP